MEGDKTDGQGAEGHVAWIGLGANLGDAAGTLRAAVDALSRTDGVADVTLSRFYQSAPIDSSGPPYVNAVARIATQLAPLALLDLLQRIELDHGRERPYRNAPRTIDLDLLRYDDVHLDTERLTLPHPRMHERRFVLDPLRELAPEMVLPQGRIADLAAACAGQDVTLLAE